MLVFLPTWARQGVRTLPKSLLLLGGVTTWKVFLYRPSAVVFFLCAKMRKYALKFAKYFFVALIIFVVALATLFFVLMALNAI